MILLLKALHIIALSVWCGMLVGLPLMLARYRKAGDADRWAAVRIGVHKLYRMIATPAAVLAVASGIALIFVRGVFTEWMLVKLALVGMMVAGHALIGHIVIKSGKVGPGYRPPAAFWLLLAVMPPMLGVLAVVSWKPDLGHIAWPDALSEPRMRQSPFSAVPNR